MNEEDKPYIGLAVYLASNRIDIEKLNEINSNDTNNESLRETKKPQQDLFERFIYFNMDNIYKYKHIHIEFFNKFGNFYSIFQYDLQGNPGKIFRKQRDLKNIMEKYTTYKIFVSKEKYLQFFDELDELVDGKKVTFNYKGFYINFTIGKLFSFFAYDGAPNEMFCSQLILHMLKKHQIISQDYNPYLLSPDDAIEILLKDKIVTVYTKVKEELSEKEIFSSNNNKKKKILKQRKIGNKQDNKVQKNNDSENKIVNVELGEQDTLLIKKEEVKEKKNCLYILIGVFLEIFTYLFYLFTCRLHTKRYDYQNI